ncbi:hypothetical protein [Moritella sp. F3]|uniref:hypothetical protein n=1 Tax=Moritella sp. F3 TaxID=2718882 RepID=UPI0018E1B002|nr:hypothetical protein [Moritella sp. F3]GIC75943.1 hypothetical protein FMO001_06700 [Moritella sp. F1]GIC81482.1 hypothetical protein FMO003_17630 [Moritella sp. F3]
MKLFFKYISLAVLTAVLFGCGSEGNSTPDTITPPIVMPEPPPVIDAQLSAMDFHTAVQFSQPNQPLTFNISNYVAYSKANHIRLKDIEVLSDSQTCQISNIDAEQQSFTINPNKADSCDYRYTISTEGEDKSAWASITFSAVKGVQKARNDYQVIPKDNLLPDINKATSVGDTITFSIYDELSSELLAMTNPVFDASTVVVGSGLAFITKNGDFSYNAIDIGVTKVSYSVVDDNGLAFTGLINIDVSGDINTAPIANNATYGRTQGVGNELTLDIMKFPGFGPLVEDAEGDRIQLVSIQAFNAEVKLADANDVANTSFTFRGDSKAVYTVNYTVYDHEVDGISSGTITIETDYIREGVLEFSFNGFIKLFGDGELGAAGRNTLMRPFKDDLIPYMQDNGLYATGLKNIGFGNYKIDMSSENGGGNKIILFTADNALQEGIENIITLPASSQIYYGLTYADRILGYGGLVFEVTQASELNVHNQIYGTSNASYKKLTDKINALKLSDVKKVESFGPLSAVVFFNDGTATYYSIYVPDGKLVVLDWTARIGKVSQCWDAPNGPSQVGTHYCIKSDQSGDAFWFSESSLDHDKGNNFYIKFLKNLKSKQVKIVKTTQVNKGIAALTDKGDLYVSFNGKDVDGNTYAGGKRVARRVMSYQQASNYVTYMHMVEDDYRANKNNSSSNEARDSYYLEFNGYAQYHREQLPDGTPLNMTLDFSKISHSNRKKVKFYENTANAVALLIDDKLKILTHKGLKEYGGRDHHNNIIGDSGNSFGVYTATAGQGRSTFFARGNKTAHQDHWELYSPLEELDSSLTCDNKPKHGEVSYPYILTGCTYLDFKMNGAVIASPGSNISVHPAVRFANEDATGKVYPDLVDLDKDGLSTESEVEQCLADRSKYHAGDIEYCSQPILSDSDGDDVLDSFEFLHQDKAAGKGNYQSRYSNIVGDYHDNTFAPFDGNKDIDNNGQDDKYDH